MYSTRNMLLTDYDQVLALWKSTDGIGLDQQSDSRDGIARYLKLNENLSYIAEVNRTIIGAVLCGHDGRRGYLHHLAVDKAHRALGIGKALVTCCLEALASVSIPKCNIFLFNANETGRSFWLHNGWNHRTDLSILQKITNE